MHCFAGMAMGSGPGGEMPWRYSSPGPRRQTSEWKEEFAGVQHKVVHSFGLSFPTASNIRVMPLLSKAFKTLKRPSETLAVVGLWESWNHCWSLWWWDNRVSVLPGEGASFICLLCHTSHADCKICTATGALLWYIASASSTPGSWWRTGLSPGHSYAWGVSITASPALPCNPCDRTKPDTKSKQCNLERVQLWIKGW